MNMRLSPTRASLELVLASAVWGLGFTVTSVSLRELSPFWLSFVRFLLLSVVSLPYLLLPKVRPTAGLDQFKLALWPGIYLGASITFQTWGLQYTTATKSGFITCLYVLMVPFLERYLGQKKLPASHIFYVVLGLIGTALICDFQGESWNVGDFLTFLCAVAGAGQIYAIGVVADRIQSSLVFNLYQSIWSAAVAAVAISFFETSSFPTSLSAHAIWGIVFLSLVSTLVGFTLQVRAQRVLSPSISAMLFLLESPFAALFAFLILNERLNLMQWLGAVIIMTATIGTVRQIRSEQV